MSRSNAQAHQPGSAMLSPGLGKERVADIQMEIGRAFEVASAIEKAIRVAGGEGLRQFLARVVKTFYETDNFSIYRSSEYRINCPAGIESITVQIFRDSNSRVPSSIMVNVRAKDFKPSPVVGRVSKCLEKSGFEITDPGTETGTVSTNFREMQTVTLALLIDTLHSVLRDAWGITRKEDIVCYLEYQNEYVWEDDESLFRGRKLVSNQELRDCLNQIISHESKLVSLVLVNHSRKPLVHVNRSPTEFALTVETWELTSKQKAGLEAVFANTSFNRDLAYSSADSTVASWIGQSDPESLELLICKMLAVVETNLESGNVYSQLHVPFV